MEYGVDIQKDSTVSEVDPPQQVSTTNPAIHDSNPPQGDLLDLIDLAAPDTSQDASIVQKPLSPSISSKSFVEDLVGLQPTPADIQTPILSQQSPIQRVSVLPSRTRSLKRSKRGGSRVDELSNNRCSTPESIASEKLDPQEDKLLESCMWLSLFESCPYNLFLSPQVDPYTQWYQVMQNYYRQFYPGYDYGNPSVKAEHRVHAAPRHVPKSVVPLIQAPTQSVNQASQHQQQQQMQTQPPFSFPGFPSLPPMPLQGHPGGVPNLPQMQLPGYGQMPEYAEYYYRYFLGAWLAANGWPMPTGRTTPKVFIEPHIRATLVTPGLLIQILPNRPQDGEPGRIELLDISQLASDVVADFTSRLSAVSMTERKPTAHHHGIIFPNSYSSDAGLASSTNEDGDSRMDDIDEEEEEYMGLVNAWDRTDHVLYPGPLSQGTTLKHDVQAFLRGKVEDIQDRMPVDWDSAGLLLSYLELLIKNNGVVHPGDVVNLLLGNDNSRTYDYPVGPNNISSVAPNISSRVARQSSFNMHATTPSPIAAIGGGIGGALYLGSASGRESPRVLSHSASTGGFLQLNSQQQGSGQRSAAASSTGGVSISRSLRRGLLAEYGNAQERETAALQRFRELLMHGHPLKALDQACQTHLWGHAFALALRLGPGPLDRVMEKFLARSVNPSDPLLTLYQLTAGEIPHSVDQFAYTGGTDTGDWRPHLAMLLSAPEGHAELARESLERMGESLLARRLLFAAHLCFLLAAAAASNSAGTTTPHMPPRIWLLGVPAPSTKPSEETGKFVITTEVERASTEAIQLTEVYEFALALATRDKNFFLPHFLPFKFAYCLRLIDAGLIEKAFRYLMVLSTSISTLLEREVEESDLSPIDLRALYLIASQCLCLSERLRHHPEVGSFESATGSHSDAGFSGGANSPPPHWLERLSNIFQRVSTMLGLPNSERPYVDPLCVSSSQEPPQQQQVQQDQKLLQQVPQAHVPTTAGSAFQTQPASGYSQPSHPSQQNPPPPQQQQQQNVHYQSPPQQQPKQTTALQTPPTPQPQYQPTIHDNTSPSQNQPPSPPSIFHQEQGQMSHDPHSPSFQQQQQFSDQPLAHSPPSSKVLEHRFHQQPEPQQLKSSVENAKNHDYFVPTFNPSAGTMEGGSNAVAAPGYDYFAGLGSSQPANRSRTVSMTSSQDGSTYPSSPSPSAIGGGVGMLHSSSPVPPQVQRRSSGGQPAVVANSSGYRRCSHYSSERRAFKRPGLEPCSQLRHRRVMPSDMSDGERTPTPRLSPIAFRRTLMRDYRSRNTPSYSKSSSDGAKMNHTPTFAAAPPADNRRKVSEQFQQPQPEKQEEKEEVEEKKDNGGQSGKSGWFSGLFGRIKPAGHEVYLPDDSNPSIVWDEATGRWRDKLGGDADESIPLPPQMPSAPAVAQNSTSVSPPLLAPHVRGSGGGAGNTRSRYVNVLAKQGVSSGPKAVNFTPPLPPNILPSS
ncbi:hypothetical protein Aperf_G00000112257 [Anoplocephala perfoliata]